jgi:lysophospholipase L1-like esterase
MVRLVTMVAMEPVHTPRRPIRAAVAACISLLALASVASPASGAGGGGSVVSPGAYHLSLGDSMAFGLQFDRLFEMLDAGTYTPDAFDTGFTDVLAAKLQQLRPDQQTVNLSCPGESTDTMIDGGCEFALPEPDGLGLALHTTYPGPQLDAAVSFLTAHPGEVSPITVAIGGNDAIDVIAGKCGGDAACVERSGLRAHLAAKLDHILVAIRRAAPDAEVVVVGFHNPFTVDAPGSDGVWRANYTSAQRDAAQRNGARFVDAFPVIQGPHVCELTFLCASGDPHPTDEGYQRIGELIFDALRHGRP